MNRKADLKKTGDELQAYLQFRRRGSKVENRKGKGAYTRKQKHKESREILCLIWPHLTKWLRWQPSQG